MACKNCDICAPYGIRDGLIAYIDSSLPESWTPPSENTVYSIERWNNAKNANMILADYGLAMVDAGKADSMFASPKEYVSDDLYLTLDRPMQMDASGNTFPIGTVSGATISIVGNPETVTLIEILDGAYFQGNFKLEGYDREILPYRFKDGFTFSTRIYNESIPSQKGYFLYYGTRAENKFATEVCEEAFTYDSTNGTIGGDHPNFLEKSVYGNALGFFLDSKGRIGYTYIDESGKIKESVSCKALAIGFSNIDFVFYPNNGILDLDCSPRRKGRLKVYVNGLLFWDVQDFDEPWLKGMDAKPNHQIEVPYNISWGGGTDGLKYHWRYKESLDYWLRENLYPTSEALFRNRWEGKYDTDYTVNLQYSGETYMYADLTANFECKPKKPYLIRIDVPSLKSDHIYRTVLELQSLNSSPANPDLDYEILSSIHPRLQLPSGRQYESIAELCTPISYSGSTADDTWLYEVYFRVEKDCIETNGFIYFDYEQSILPIVSNFRVYRSFLDEIFYNYKCRTEYCETPQTATEIDCNGSPVEIVIDSEPCENIYQKDCNLLGLMLERIYSYHYEGMLNKLRIYERPITLDEIRANWTNDQMELGIMNPAIGRDQSQPNPSGRPSRNC